MGYSASEKFLTPEEVAERWRCTINRVYQLLKEGKLAYIDRDLGTDADRAQLKTISISGEKLAEARRLALLSQEEFAQMVGIAKGSLVRLEAREVSAVLPSNFRKLAAAFKIDPDELSKRIGATGPKNKVKKPGGRKRKLIPWSAIRSMEESWHGSSDNRTAALSESSTSSATARKRGRPSKGVSSPSW